MVKVIPEAEAETKGLLGYWHVPGGPAPQMDEMWSVYVWSHGCRFTEEGKDDVLLTGTEESFMDPEVK